MKLLLATLLLTGCVAGQGKASDFTHRIENLTGGVCSSTAIGSRSLLTASHCIDPDQKVLVVDGTTAGILHIERDNHDHAIVVLTIVFPDIATRGPDPVVGDKVHWIGQPMGLKNIHGEGLIVGEYEGRQLIDGSQIWFGSSGAALLNEQGQVVGVISGILTQQIFKLGFGFPLNFTPVQWASVR